MAGLGYATAAAGGLSAVVLGLAGIGGTTFSVRAPGLLPLGGLEFSLDPLSGFFLALIGGTAVPASIYAIGYGERRGLLA
jgi:hydrogenase-4 component B